VKKNIMNMLFDPSQDAHMLYIGLNLWEDKNSTFSLILLISVDNESNSLIETDLE
jgi:hypothetical protein